MKPYSFPLAYLKLESERGWPTYIRDLPGVLAFSLVLTGPFALIDQSIFFAKDGFIDKFSAFSGVLTGFYVAALIAIASLVPASTDLDNVITKGSVFLKEKRGDKGRKLTRRQYVCLMFGYLAFLSVFLSIVSIAIVSLAYGVLPSWLAAMLPSAPQEKAAVVQGIRAGAIYALCIPIAHMAITTLRGLYYLTERIYVRAPRLLKPQPEHSDDPSE